MSLVHGGPGVKCLAESCYQAIVKETGTQNLHCNLNDVPDYELKLSFDRVLKASNVEEATQIINDAKLDVVIDMAGTLQAFKTTDDIRNMIQKTIDWYVLGRVQPAYNSFIEGLQVLGVLEAMRKPPPHLMRSSATPQKCSRQVVLKCCFQMLLANVKVPTDDWLKT
jgi:hypothetical protein